MQPQAVPAAFIILSQTVRIYQSEGEEPKSGLTEKLISDILTLIGKTPMITFYDAFNRED